MKKIQNLIQNKVFVILLISLIVFLPISSWLVSILGNPNISLVRDLLVFLLALLFLSNIPNRIGKISGIVLLFVIYGITTYFWREASVAQWLRGFRFTFVPMILFIVLANTSIQEKSKKNIYLASLILAVVLIIISIFEYMGFNIPITSKLSGSYGMEPTQFVQGLGVPRLQSLLAGPNALGVYLIAISSIVLGYFSFKNKNWLWLMVPLIFVLFFTYSRSAWLGVFCVIVSYGFFVLIKKIGVVKTSFLTILLLMVSLFSINYLYNKADYKNLITHADSTDIRITQYERVWNSRFEIGLFGRGMGTAGPSSQNRLDGGPNHFTENIYLDIFEETGLLGLLLYLTIIFWSIGYSWKYRHESEGLTAFLINIGFFFAGFFINYYTGQVGIYLLWIVNALFLSQCQLSNKNINSNNFKD